MPITKPCTNCGEPITRPPSQMGDKVFCNFTCLGEYRRKEPVIKICPQCDNDFIPSRPEYNHCSPQCYGASIRGKKRGPCLKRRRRVILVCPVCDIVFERRPSEIKGVSLPTCSTHCNGILRGQEWKAHAHKGRAAWTDESERSFSEKMSGLNNPAWKGGVTYRRRKGRYAKSVKYVQCPPEFASMARKDGYVMEHRLIMAQSLDRPLLRSEVVHHINHDTSDNRIDNLRLFASNSAHKRHEGETGYFKDYYHPRNRTSPHNSQQPTDPSRETVGS